LVLRRIDIIEGIQEEEEEEEEEEERIRNIDLFRYNFRSLYNYILRITIYTITHPHGGPKRTSPLDAFPAT
jgi:hypothetical protein